MAEVKYLWIPVIAVFVVMMLIGCQSSAVNFVTSNSTSEPFTRISLNVTQPQDESIIRSNPVTVSGSVPSGAEVMVNGISVCLENSHFSVMVELEAGPNMIEILARDTSGKETARYINVVYIP